MSDEKIYSVSEINQLCKVALESRFRSVLIEGEVSNLSRPQSGHIYFTLKDDKAQIRAVQFRGALQSLNFEIKNGLKVHAAGTVSIYSASGSYQLICSRIKPAGKGSLQEAFDKLKKKLAEEGLFESDKKLRIPLLPQHIGLVTSPTGAAVRDIINVTRRRYPNLHILIAPVMVQGDDAARQIAHAVDYFNQRGDVDVIIVARGGGSMEDLWAFNEEIVARSIARSRIPIISGVGHETDFTISDFAADLRAPTPSAAAEIVVGRKIEFERTLEAHERHMKHALKSIYLEKKNRFASASSSYVFREPHNLLRIYRQRIENLLDRARSAAVGGIRACQQKIDESQMIIDNRIGRRLETDQSKLQTLRVHLSALDPHRVLQRGYSITRNASGKALRSVTDVKPGSTLSTQIQDGFIKSNIEQVEGVQNEER